MFWRLLLSLMFILVACQPVGETPLRIGMVTWPGGEHLYLAERMGFFQEAGLAVELVEFTSLGDCRRAFDDGQLDGMVVTLVEVIHSLELSRRSPRVALALDRSTGGDLILAHSHVKNLGDLRGRRVGVEVSTLGSYLLHRALEKAGLTMGDVTVTPGSQKELARLFKTGDVDAVVTYEPGASAMATAPGSHTLFTSREIPGEVVDVLAMDAALFASREEELAHLPLVWERALDYARRHPDEAHLLMAQRERVSVAVFRHALTGMELIPLAEQSPYFGPDGLLLPLLQRLHDIMVSHGMLTMPMRHDLNKVVGAFPLVPGGAAHGR